MDGTKRVYLFTYRLQRSHTWVKEQVGELAAIAEVVVKGVYEVEEVKEVKHTTVFRKREVTLKVNEGYSYYAEVLGPGLCVERFELLVRGFVRGYNSRSVR